MIEGKEKEAQESSYMDEEKEKREDTVANGEKEKHKNEWDESTSLARNVQTGREEGVNGIGKG